MAARQDAVEKYNIFNSLVSVPTSMVGWNTIVDLNNDCSVAGKVDEVDGYMNITMTNVVFIDQRLRKHAFSTFHIQARNFRLIHIPEKFNVNDQVRQLIGRMGGRDQRKAKGTERTHKVKRANARQQETLRELAQAEKSRASESATM